MNFGYVALFFLILVTVIVAFVVSCCGNLYLSDFIKYSKMQDVLNNDENNLLKLLSLHFGQLMILITKSNISYKDEEKLKEIAATMQDGIVYIIYKSGDSLYNLTIDYSNADNIRITSDGSVYNNTIIRSIENICNDIAVEYTYKDNIKDEIHTECYKLAMLVISYIKQLNGIRRIEINDNESCYCDKKRV